MSKIVMVPRGGGEADPEMVEVGEITGRVMAAVAGEQLGATMAALCMTVHVEQDQRRRMFIYYRERINEDAKHAAPESLLRAATQAPAGREGGDDQGGGRKADGGESLPERSIPRGPFKPRGFA